MMKRFEITKAVICFCRVLIRPHFSSTGFLKPDKTVLFYPLVLTFLAFFIFF